MIMVRELCFNLWCIEALILVKESKESCFFDLRYQLLDALPSGPAQF